MQEVVILPLGQALEACADWIGTARARKTTAGSKKRFMDNSPIGYVVDQHYC